MGQQPCAPIFLGCPFPPVPSGSPEGRCSCIWPSLDPFPLSLPGPFCTLSHSSASGSPTGPLFGRYTTSRLLLGRCPGIIHTESSAQLTTGREPQIPVYSVMTACVLHPASSLCLASWLREGSDPGQQPWGTRPCPPQGWPDAGCCQVGPRGTGVSVEATLAPRQRLGGGLARECGRTSLDPSGAPRSLIFIVFLWSTEAPTGTQVPPSLCEKP